MKEPGFIGANALLAKMKRRYRDLVRKGKDTVSCHKEEAMMVTAANTGDPLSLSGDSPVGSIFIVL